MTARAEQLVKDLYRSPGSKPGPFDLRNGQERNQPERLGYRMGWFNADGERLGFGDLSTGDLARIEREIQEGEAFIATHEESAFWRLHSGDSRGLSFDSPGRDYVTTHCMYMVVKGRILSTVPLDPSEEEMGFEYIDEQGVKAIVDGL